MKGKEKRQFRLLGEEEKEEEIIGAAGRGTRKKKGEAGALINAVTILASAKKDREDKRYDLLNRHLIQQGDLRREELQLERERLAIESEKAKVEQTRIELMMLQLQESLRSNLQSQTEKHHSIIEHLNNLSDA